ncbi:helix-turn-helix domain-containing protein [Massilia sp. METH4]|uniref:TetR/AcrR family transcriptional regulator n=1 Tax=Massilia sp. METH4 TaxID=3123041 RepID=UPI0030CCE2F0
MSDSIHPPKQKRSEETLASLLAATIRVLDEAGLDGATIPRIATLAGVAPASVYRRFVSKDALIRAALLSMLRNSQAQGPSLARGETLPQAARRLMALLFQQYRTHPRLLRALSRFMDTDQDAAFVSEARTIVAANLELLIEPLLVYRPEISHGDPRAALRFALLQALTSIEAIALESYSLWHIAVAGTDEELAGQFADGFVAYLTRR